MGKNLYEIPYKSVREIENFILGCPAEMTHLGRVGRDDHDGSEFRMGRFSTQSLMEWVGRDEMTVTTYSHIFAIIWVSNLVIF